MPVDSLINRKVRPANRAVAALVAACIAFTSVVPSNAADLWTSRRDRRAAPQLASADLGAPLILPPAQSLRIGESAPFIGKDRIADLLSSLPAAAGRVRSVTLPAGGAPRAIVIHIQDVHRNAEAQGNISAAVTGLIAAHKADFIALEGAWDTVDLTSFRGFSDRTALADAAATLLRQNFLTGPILAALTAEVSVPVVGVDDRALHTANADAARAALARQPDERNEIDRERLALAADLAAATPLLRKLIPAAERYDAGTLPLSDYLVELGAAGIGVPDQIRAFQSAFAIERSLDFSRVERERATILGKLVQKLTAEAVGRLLADTASYRAGSMSNAEFYGRLDRLCAANGVDLTRTPAMASYLRYVILADGIDGDRLFDEVRSYESRAMNAAATTPTERKLVARAADVRRRAKLSDLALAPAEWTAGSKAAPGNPFESFYARAADRDLAMAGNLLRAIDQRHARTAVLVTGGFHGPGIARILRREGVAVVAFVPALTRVDPANATSYLSVFAQKKTPLDRLFEGPKLFLAEQVMTSPNRARLGVVTAAIALRRGATPLGAIRSFLENGLRWTSVTLRNLQDTVRIRGERTDTSGTKSPAAVDVRFDDPTNPIVTAAPIGVWDAWRPLWRQVREDAQNLQRPRWTVTAFLAATSIIEELISRPLIQFAIMPLLVMAGLPLVAAWTVTVVVTSLIITYGLHINGLLAWRDGTDKMSSNSRLYLLGITVLLGTTQAALSYLPFWIVLPVLATAHATLTLARFRRDLRSVAIPAGPPFNNVAEAAAAFTGSPAGDRMPRVMQAIDYLEANPSPEALALLIKVAKYAWIMERNALVRSRIRQAIRWNRYNVEVENGPSETVRQLVREERIILSETASFRQKRDAIRRIVSTPAAPDVSILADALNTFSRRNPELASLLLKALQKVRDDGILQKQPQQHDTIRGTILRAITELHLPPGVGRFNIVALNNGRTIEIRWSFPEGKAFLGAEELKHTLRRLFNARNQATDPDMRIIPDPLTRPMNNRGAIRLDFNPDIASLTDFQRVLGVDQFVRGVDDRFRGRTPVEIADLIEEQVAEFVNGINPDDPMRAALLDEAFGDAARPGIVTAVRDLRSFGGNEIIPIESYDEIDPETNLPRSAKRTSVYEMRELGEALPYLTHYIPEKDVDSWIFLGRSAAPHFVAATMKSYLAGKLEQRDHIVIVSRDTISRKLWMDVHLKIIELAGNLDLDVPHVPNFKGIRLVMAQWLRERLYFSPSVSVKGNKGVLRYREAIPSYDDEGRLVEQIPVYDRAGADSRKIGDVWRRRDLGENEAPEYFLYRPVGRMAAPVSTSDVVTEGDDPYKGLFAHVIQQVRNEIDMTSALRNPLPGKTSSDPFRAVVVDEIGWGTFPNILATALEETSRLPDDELPVNAELRAFRAQDPFTLTEAQVDRWDALEAERRRERAIPGVQPIEVQIFIGAPPVYESTLAFYNNQLKYPAMDPLILGADFDKGGGDSNLVTRSVSSVADNTGNSYFVDTSLVKGHPFRDSYRNGPILNYGTPIFGQPIPLGLEVEAVQLGSYLKDLYIYNGVVKFYEREYERVAVTPLVDAALNGSPKIQEEALRVLLSYPYPSAVRALVKAARDDPARAPTILPTADKLLRSVLVNALEFPTEGLPRVLNLELLIDQEKFLTELAGNEQPVSIRSLAAQALAALGNARNNFRVTGLSIGAFLALTPEQKTLLRRRGQYVVAIRTTDPAGQEAELTRAAKPLGIGTRAMADANWTAPSIDEANGTATVTGGLIPAVTRRALVPFVDIMVRLFRLSPASAISIYRFVGAGVVEETMFSGAAFAVAGGLVLFAGAPIGVAALAVYALFVPLRLLFIAAHPEGRRTGPTIIVAFAGLAMILPFLFDGHSVSLLVTAALSPLVAHLGVNAVTDLARSDEERAAERVAIALVLAERGRPENAAAAIEDLLARANPNLRVNTITGTRAVDSLTAATEDGENWDGAAFGRALGRELRNLAGRASLTEPEAKKALVDLARRSLGYKNAPTLGTALDRVNAEQADLKTPSFIHAVVDETAAERSEDLLRVMLARRKTPTEPVLLTAMTEAAADRLRAAVGTRENVTIEVFTGHPDRSGDRVRVRVTDLPAIFQGARPRALIASEGIELDLEGLSTDSPYRAAAILMINLALKAVILPSVGDLERTARLISTQA